jgi:predicted metal-dependent hydrolase
MTFEIPASYQPVYMAGNAAVSYSFTGLGLYVAVLEPFIVKSGLRARQDRLAEDFRSYLEERSDKFRVGFVEGFESYTTQGALEILASRVCDHPRTEASFGHLFRWHMLEEIEHRNVAFDIYEHLYGDYFYRARMCWFAQGHMQRFIGDCVRIMSGADVLRHGERCRVSRLERLGMAVQPLTKRIRSMLPGYSPHRYRIPDAVAGLSDRYTKLADSTY